MPPTANQEVIENAVGEPSANWASVSICSGSIGIIPLAYMLDTLGEVPFHKSLTFGAMAVEAGGLAVLAWRKSGV